MGTSGVLAAVALLANSVPVLMGAMIVAPALPPLALVAIAIVAGEARLALRGIALGVLGLSVAFAMSMLTTWLFNATGVLEQDANLLHRPLLEERVRPGWYSAAAGLAAGVAGGIATLKRKVDTLIGTVASVALVPAGTAGAIAFMAGDASRAWGGFVTLHVNAGLIVGMTMLVVTIAAPAHRDPADERPDDDR
jgi:uncharacterized hydrophobic protein (TIGR00271 family)